MKALTISQPFASLIAAGVKWIENRTWPTRYRGPLAIHAGLRSRYLPAGDLRRYPRGVIIATGQLVGCCELVAIHDDALAGSGRTAADVLEHAHTEGPFCWVLADVELVVPTPAIGSLGLWDYDGPPLAPLEPQESPLAHLGPLTSD